MPFLGISYILVYLGAIIVLFLFVIMMINVKLTDILETGYQYTKNIPLALTVSALFLYEFYNVLPSFLNSPALPLDSSILLSLSKEIVLTINTLFMQSSNFVFGLLGLTPMSLTPTASAATFGSEGTGIFLSFAYPSDLSSCSGATLTPPLPIAEGGVKEGSESLGNLPLITQSAQNWPETLISTSSASQIVSVAYNLYTYGAFLFMLLSIILLLAMIAPIYISKK